MKPSLSTNITEFIEELALLLESGISDSDALKIVQQGQENPVIQQLIKDIINDVENKMSLADSFAKYPHYFEPFIVEMLSQNKETQTTTLMKIAKYRQSMEIDGIELTKKIVSSSAHTISLLVIFLVIISFMLIYVIPVFADMFDSFGSKLPVLTQLAVNLSDFFVAYWFFIMGSLAILIGISWMKWQMVKLYLPLFGELYRKVALIRSLRTCVFMLSEGASIAKAFTATAQAVNNPIYAKIFNQVSQQTTEGMNLSDALQAHSILPKKVVYSAIIGTKTNRLDNLFDKLANVYTKKLLSSIELTIKSYTSLLTIIMGVIIGLLVISMYMPIFVMGSVI